MMLFTGSMTIKYLTIPILTVFKNMTNLIIAWGDWFVVVDCCVFVLFLNLRYFFDQIVSVGVIGSFLMMTLGSVMSGATDLNFSLEGYLWMLGNVLSQVSYSSIFFVLIPGMLCALHEESAEGNQAV
jgi:GDP-mannose transporter